MSPDRARHLAIHGGSPVRGDFLPYGRQSISEADLAAVGEALRSDWLTTGPKVGEFEEAVAAAVGAREAVAVSSGTAALHAAVHALGIGPGDEVLVPALTFAASANCVVFENATPVFVDVDPDSCNLDPASLEDAIVATRRAGVLTPRAVIAVDLFGRPADYPPLRALARAHGLFLLQDAAQSFGARWQGEPAGRQGDAAATSFYPAKPLGAYGDGGAVLTDDPVLAAEIRLLRLHGEQPERMRYQHLRIGLNSRLDTLQAAILLVKLEVLEEDLQRRAALAARYDAALGRLALRPPALPDGRSAWAQYTIRVPTRDRLRTALARQGIPTAIYYPIALHRQPAYHHFPIAPCGLPVAEALAATVLSLPMHPDLAAGDQARIIDAVLRFEEKGA